MIQNFITLKPVITEKSLVHQDSQDKYAFWVATNVTKSQITAAFKGIFGINPVSVNTTVVKGKFKTNWKTRKTVQKSNRKKAIITVPKGTKIELLKLKTK